MKVTFFSCLFNCDKFIDSYILNFINLKLFKDHFLIITNVTDSNNESTNTKIINFCNLKNIKCLNITKDKDPGLYECWNNMIKIAVTELVCNVNPDDRILPEFIDLIKEFKNDEGLICTPLNIFYNDKFGGYWHHKKNMLILDNFYEDSYDKKIEYYDKMINNINIPVRIIQLETNIFDIFDMFTFRGKINNLQESKYYSAQCIPGCCPIWKKELFNKNGGFNESEFNESADFELWCRFLSTGVKMRCVNKHMVDFRYDLNSKSNNKTGNNIFEKIFNLYHPVKKNDGR